MGHLLVTNDFPPKIGGIQSYLWELWRRLPADRVTVLTTPHADAAAFDAAAPFRVVRTRQKVLLPTRRLARKILSLAHETQSSLVVLDPALPVGFLGPYLARAGLPYALVLHGAEVTVPGRLPFSRWALGRVLRGAVHVIAAGGYPLAEGERAARRSLAATVVPPGVDVARVRPVTAEERVLLRERLGLPGTGPLVVSASRLVPRKGMDTLIRASEVMVSQHPGLVVAISGAGRDRRRLDRLAAMARKAGADVRLLGRLDEDDLRALYQCGDVFAMLCRNRWGGLEQEGFGIVFVEAAAAGTTQVAGRSGGAAEAVVHGVTGAVVDNPRDTRAAVNAISALLADVVGRERMALVGRRRVEEELSYDVLAARLDRALLDVERGAAVGSIERDDNPRDI